MNDLEIFFKTKINEVLKSVNYNKIHDKWDKYLEIHTIVRQIMILYYIFIFCYLFVYRKLSNNLQLSLAFVPLLMFSLNAYRAKYMIKLLFKNLKDRIKYNLLSIIVLVVCLTEFNYYKTRDVNKALIFLLLAIGSLIHRFYEFPNEKDIYFESLTETAYKFDSNNSLVIAGIFFAIFFGAFKI